MPRPTPRRALAVMLTLAGLAGSALLPGGPAAADAAPGPGPSSAFVRAMQAGMRPAGARSGAEVVDLTTGQTLYAQSATVPRIPASVEKLYTTSTVLARFGPGATLSTDLFGSGQQIAGTWNGPLYLRGAGDPTFGSAAFDHRAYGAGATVQELVTGLRDRGIRAVRGPIYADASLFDSEQGTLATGGRPSIYVEGALSALAFNRDWADDTGSVYYADPPRHAGQALLAALRAGGIQVSHTGVHLARAPAGATLLAAARSPTMARLVRLTNTPSDNFFAEMLTKGLGARFGAGGTTAAGAAVIRATIAQTYGLRPTLYDGSGLAYRDRTSPAQVIALLTAQRDDSPFRDSLSVLGRTGTLLYEDPHTVAAGRCAGKTGTLSDVSNVVGYCHAQNGDLLAYAFLMNGVDPDAAHLLQDSLQLALVGYGG